MVISTAWHLLFAVRVRVQCLLVLFIYNDFIWKNENYIDIEITYVAWWPVAALEQPNAQQYSDCSHTHTRACVSIWLVSLLLFGVLMFPVQYE